MLQETELKREQCNKIISVLGDNNLMDYIPDTERGFKDTFIDIVRCENLINKVMPQSREDTLFNEFQKGNKIVLGCF